ncbi:MULTISPECIES: hypothetical protein [Acidovorax]|uniref:Uncharacterized protein n=1 Tax=Acidovorax facilis TaxID=12917 RepID=A0ABV8D728_9BURK|nr:MULTISPECIES: hypothetical protein [Acidovorax]MBO1011757.1 hypothetical protein [Acidovorax sp. SD340]MCO4245650.1 hypothetical protein [Acidovorax facilis]
MIKSRYQLQKERSQARFALEKEKDTIYYLDFIPKDGQATGRSTLLDDPWCVRLICNPKDKPQLIEEAVAIFEKRHNVESWREVASCYKVNSFWFP